MNKPDFGQLQQGIRSAIQALPGGQKPSQDQVWRAVSANPVTLARYVQQRTGASGDALVMEVARYSRAMKERYG